MGEPAFEQGEVEITGDVPRRMDRALILVSLLLVSFGLVMVYSASAVVAAEDRGQSAYFLKRQLIAVSVGTVGMFVLAWTPVRLMRRYAIWLYAAVIAALVLVFVPGVGYTANGATRWIGAGSIHFQPSELAKLALILVLAGYVDRNRGMLDNFKEGVLPALLMAAPCMFLVLIEPDFGTTVLLCGITCLALLYGGLPLRWMGWLAVSGVAAGGVLVMASTYRLERVRSWLDPWAVADGDGYQVIQSWLALNTGGLWGQGLGNSLAKLRFLPEPWTDFIAAVVGEELGYIGLVLLLVAYGVFLWRGTRIALRSRSYYGLLVASIITTLIGVQAGLNLGVVLGALPPKGLVLPFMSYGASAIMVHMWSVGVLLSISVDGPVRTERLTSMLDGVRERVSRIGAASEPTM